VVREIAASVGASVRVGVAIAEIVDADGYTR
jgi:hypothetical protein